MTKTGTAYPQNPHKASYKQGWNDRYDNIWLTVVDSTTHYRDGWKACDAITEDERTRNGKI